MTWFGFILCAEPCIFDAQSAGLRGFYTARYVKASDRKEAELKLWARLQDDKGLSLYFSLEEIAVLDISIDRIVEYSSYPPALGWWWFKDYGGRGFTFFLDGT